MGLTATDIVRAIGRLPRNQDYNYINPSTTTKIIIERVAGNEGPIYIKRYDPTKGQARNQAKADTISTEMIWRVANAVREHIPINIDRIVGASYNTRSVLETLLAHTPQFHYCYPGRIHLDSLAPRIKRGHKHIIYTPDNPHPQGVLTQLNTSLVISEIPSVDAVYEALTGFDAVLEPGINIEMARRHAQIQIALVHIGKQLGYRTWIAQNDRGIVYNDRPIAEMESVIARLEDERLIQAYQDAQHAARLIDVVWFKNGRLMPAVIEVEHSTRVRTGLTRMKTFQDTLPEFPTRWVIAAPDEDRDLVMREAGTHQFKSLDARFFPYSAVEELYNLCERRKIKGVSEEFLDCYMERCLPLLP